jgi:hypothetical protein
MGKGQAAMFDPGHTTAPSLQRAPSALSTHSTSSAYGAYMEPPLAVAQQQQYYGFAPAPAEYWTANPPPMSMGMGGPQVPQMVQQPQRAQMYPATQPQSGLVRGPSQSAAVQLAPGGQGNYLSNYTSPVSPTAMPNPFDGPEEGGHGQRMLKVGLNLLILSE